MDGYWDRNCATFGRLAMSFAAQHPYCTWWPLRRTGECCHSVSQSALSRCDRWQFGRPFSFRYRYWTVTNIDYNNLRTPRRVFLMIFCVWFAALIVSLAPQFGWKDPDYMKRIEEQHCMVSQDVGYQVSNPDCRSVAVWGVQHSLTS